MRSHQVHQGQTLMVPDALQKACTVSVFNRAEAASVTVEFRQPKQACPAVGSIAGDSSHKGTWIAQEIDAAFGAASPKVHHAQDQSRMT